MNLESINKWLDEEYGCSYTKLEELHNFYFEKYTDQKEEINKLTAESTEWEERTYCWQDRAENLQIVLDKIKENNQRIIDYGFDYDGFNNVEDLKKLIDMLVDYARKNDEILKGV